MKKILLFVFLILPFLIALPIQAQGVAVNQQGDVIYLGTTTTTTTVIASPTPTTTSQTTTTIDLSTPVTTTVPVGNNESVRIPEGFFPNFTTMVTSLLQIALVVSVILVLFQLISAGINWITSGGDKAKTDSARGKIVAAIIGLILVIASWAVFLFILQMIGLEAGQVLPFTN